MASATKTIILFAPGSSSDGREVTIVPGTTVRETLAVADYPTGAELHGPHGKFAGDEVLYDQVDDGEKLTVAKELSLGA